MKECKVQDKHKTLNDAIKKEAEDLCELFESAVTLLLKCLHKKRINKCAINIKIFTLSHLYQASPVSMIRFQIKMQWMISKYI